MITQFLKYRNVIAASFLQHCPYLSGGLPPSEAVRARE